MSSASSAVERFEQTLSETVTSEKLSGSRVEKVRNLAARDFHLASQLTRAIQSVHREASDKGKISSLYLLDAVARNAQDVVRKKASGFDYKDARPPSGSTARAGTKEAMVDAANAFLEACENIIEEMVLTTARSMRPDQKDKVTKVVDIWLKAGTFDSSRLEEIRARILDDEAGDTRRSAQKQDIRTGSGSDSKSNQSRHAAISPPPAPPNVPSNILAMLGGGGGDSGGDNAGSAATQEKISTGPQSDNPPSLDPNQLAMLKRVAAQQQQGQAETTSPQVAQKAEANRAQTDTLAFQPDVSVGDLSQFDLSSFDPTVAIHWLRLAQQWHNTYQYIPSNQELMTGLASVMQTQMYMQTQMMQSGSTSGYNATGQW